MEFFLLELSRLLKVVLNPLVLKVLRRHELVGSNFLVEQTKYHK